MEELELRAVCAAVNELRESIEELERFAVHEAVEETKGNLTQAASLLGISVSDLLIKLRRYHRSE